MSDLPATADRLSQIKAAYIGDAVCENLIKFCQDGWPEKSKLGEVMKPYWSYRGDDICKWVIVNGKSSLYTHLDARSDT